MPRRFALLDVVAGAVRVCLVAAGRAPSGRDLARVERTVAAIRERCPELEVCVAFSDTERRLAAGREVHLRTAQPLALQVADSVFLGDYLTTAGEAPEADLAMIRDAGLIVEDATGRTRTPARGR